MLLLKTFQLHSTSTITKLNSIEYIFTVIMSVLLFFGIIFNCLNFLVFHQFAHSKDFYEYFPSLKEHFFGIVQYFLHIK